MRKPHGSYVDVKPPARIMLSLLWTSMLFVFAYVDIFGFWRSDVIKGALAKKVPGPGFVIDQRFLLLTTIYILTPALMITATMLMPARITRMAHLTVRQAGVRRLHARQPGQHHHTGGTSVRPPRAGRERPGRLPIQQRPVPSARPAPRRRRGR